MYGGRGPAGGRLLYEKASSALSGALSNGLRAAGDVKFTMYVSIFSTIFCRVVFSVIFGIWMDLEVIGVAFAMCLDWGLRALLFWIRFKKGKWKEFRVIG